MNLTAADIGKKVRTRNNRVFELKKWGGCSHPYKLEEDGVWVSIEENGTAFDHAAHRLSPDFDVMGRVADAEPVVIESRSPQYLATTQDGCVAIATAEAAGPQNVLRSLPESAADRKAAPVVSGCVDYFPLAIAEVARISKAGNDQHNPGEPLHWNRGKSGDHADCIVRHLIERGTVDTDGQRHTAKVAWRALALLQEELESAAGWSPVVSAA